MNARIGDYIHQSLKQLNVLRSLTCRKHSRRRFWYWLHQKQKLDKRCKRASDRLTGTEHANLWKHLAPKTKEM